MTNMLKKIAVATFALSVSVVSAQTTFLNFDEVADSFAVGLGHPGNVVTVTDELSDFVEGSGSMRVRVELTDMVSWGTWTDISYTFPNPPNLKGYDEMRFMMKFIREPRSNSRSMQFTLDLFEDPVNGDFWRYPEDHDILYSPNALDTPDSSSSEWFEVVIPFSDLAIPSWAASANGMFDKENISKFAFGVHADSTATFGTSPFDTVEFLIDDLRLTNSTSDGLITGFEEVADSVTAGAGIPDSTTITIADNLSSFTEGSSSLDVTVELLEPYFIWGTWTDIGLNLDAPVLVGDATEFRFDIKMIKKSKRKNFVMTFDLFDTDNNELHRWGGDRERPGHTGIFNHIDIDYNEWREIVVPIADMYRPSWSTTFDDSIGSISKIAFGVHARLDAIVNAAGDTVNAGVSDTVQFLIDNVRLTHGSETIGVVAIDAANIVPAAFTLSQNYPNPFNPTTTIEYTMVNADNNVTLNIYNLRGVLMNTLVKGAVAPGDYSQVWDGRDSDGRMVASGLYFYSLKTSTSKITKSMVFLK